MAITTKRRLIDAKYIQESGDVLKLSGDTKFYGSLSLINGNQGDKKILISDINGNFDWEERGIANGLATLDSNQKIVQNIDASKINSGIIDLARLPNGALERMYLVTDETARFNLTTNDVQNGDTVKQLDTGIMYLVVDQNNLDNSSGYEMYNAGRAAAVDWSGVENKPTDITNLSLHTATELSDIEDSGSGRIITEEERLKLEGIEDGAEVNVQSDWNQTDTTSDDYIKNKPTDITNLSLHTATELSDIEDSGSGRIITEEERLKLEGIEDGAEVNVQSDWNQTDITSDDYIKNKPTDITNLSLHNINELSNINPNTVIGNNTASSAPPDQISIGEQEFLGRLSGENIKGVPAIDMYGVPSSVQTLLSNNSNWDLNNTYTGSTISGVDKGLRYYDSTFVYEFVEENTPVRYLRNPSRVAISNNFFDLDNLPKYQTIVVFNETEFIEATQILDGSSGRILFGGNISLTANRTVNLTNIVIDGNRNSLLFNGYKIITSSSNSRFENVILTGTRSSSNYGVDEILNFNYDYGNVVFANCTFRRISSFNSVSDISGTANNIVFANSTNFRMFDTFIYEDFSYSVTPLLINVTPGNTASDYLTIMLKTNMNYMGTKSYIGFTGNLAQGGDPNKNFLHTDDSIPILSGGDFLTFPTISHEGRTNFHTLSLATKSLLENNSNWDNSDNYIGTTITDARIGLKHYDTNYMYEFVTDTIPVRYLRNKSLISNVSVQSLSGTTPISNVSVQSLSGTTPTSNVSVQSLSGTTPTWNVLNGVNAQISLTGNTTITMSNLIAGMTGNLTVTNSSTAHTINFSGYTVKISPTLNSTTGTITMSGSNEIDVLSWYYDGTYLIINGTLIYE